MKIVILGSTGSIGTSTLEVVEKYSQRHEVLGLAAGKNVELLAGQIEKFKPSLVCLAEEEAAGRLRALIDKSHDVEIVSGLDGMKLVATHPDADVVVAAISGAAGLLPTISAVRAGKTVALPIKNHW